MGCSLNRSELSVIFPDKNYVISSKKIQQQDYDLDVIEMYNLALAMKHKQPTLNIEIALSCENLKEADIFGSINPMIVCFKIESDEGFGCISVEVGRTEIIPNETNPRFIKTFVLSYNEEKCENIEFHLYDIDRSKSQLQKQSRIGIVEMNMRQIVQAGTIIRQIDHKSYHKSKGKLKVSSSEYDSGNTKFQIQLAANNFMNKHQLLLKMEIFKSTEWVPIYKTESRNNHREIKFTQFEIPTNKFPDQDRGRFRIKVFESSDSKAEVQVGSTQQIYIQDIVKNQKHYIKVYKDAFIIGHISINKFQKVIRDSFISYIINGAHLHLLLAIDFSSSTQNCHTIKQDQNTSKITNQYIQAINEVVGILQYFDYYNQIPMYGFGAKLPPYYKTVSQCFALSGNFFEPIIGGGVDQLIKTYTKALKKIQFHGPSKLQQIIELACQYAHADPQSSDYYILIVFTDGNIDDKQQVAKQIAHASNFALSVLFVGIGQMDFDFLNNLSKHHEQQQRSEKQGVRRNIVQFIPYRNFVNDSSHKIIKQIFSKIPKQFIQYMRARRIKPNNNNKKQLLTTIINKQSKIAKAQYINFKINENKKLQLDKGSYVVYKPNFLGFKKRHLTKQLQEAGFSMSKLLEDMNICMNDINYFIEMESYFKQTPQTIEPPQTTLTYIKQSNKLDQLTQKKRKQVQKRTLLKLETAQSNQFGIKIRKKQAKLIELQQTSIVPDNPCIQCKINEIDIMYQPCGHICCCHKCERIYCQICKQKNTGVVTLNL